MDWTLIGAAIVTFLALLASIFSALGAARSADVAVNAEKRIALAERLAAKRELQRTASQIEVHARVTLEILVGAARTAESNATFYRHANASKYAPDVQEHSDRVKVLSNLGSIEEALLDDTDEGISRLQRDLDRTLIELTGERDWALTRAQQLSKTNDSLSDDLIAEERSKGVFQRRDHEGKLF